DSYYRRQGASSTQAIHRGPQPQPETSSSSMVITLHYSHANSYLSALARQAQGFGRCAIGGLHGPTFCVTTLSGTIELRSYLTVSSYKTINGHRKTIKFTGKGLRLKECEHVIICNLELEGGRGHDIDGIQIKTNLKHI
ncbi:putative pectate lyase 4, partial [Bienertia sinuspersici]